MEKKGKVWMNGALVDWKDATVPLLSHGFSRASAIFEIFGIHQGPKGVFAFQMDAHLKRLAQSAYLLGMEIRYSSEEIAAAVIETVKANEIGRGLVKMFAYWSEEMVIQLVPDAKLDLAIFISSAISETLIPDKPYLAILLIPASNHGFNFGFFIVHLCLLNSIHCTPI